MLVLRPISRGQARYYLDGTAPGQWLGAGSQDLRLSGHVEGPALEAVLAGRDPREVGGESLLKRVPTQRRPGFDLIWAAPKSVSLLAALGTEDQQVQFLRAHQEAVSDAVGFLERNAAWTRRGSAGNRMATTGLVAAAFSHTQSAAQDPHLHTHVVVANLVHGDDGRWSCLDSRALYHHAGAAGAVYQAALRHHLAEQGLVFDWNVDHRGLGDIVGVRRAAVDAASRRHNQVVEEIDAGLAGRVGRATAAGRTRGVGDAAGRTPAPDEGGERAGSRWRERVASAGLDQEAAANLLHAASLRRSRVHSGAAAGLDQVALARLLTERHSRFRRPDVVRAAAALAPGGADGRALERAADSFLDAALPAGNGTWTTPDLRRLEERIVAAAAPGRAPVGVVAPAAPIPGGLNGPSAAAVARLTSGGAPVDLLRGDLIAQARVLDAARMVWEASGHRVALVSPTDRGQARWRALSGVDAPPPSPAHATVLVVDDAERCSTTDLHRVVGDAVSRHAKVVLLDGGTTPRRTRAESPAMETLRATLVPVDAGPAFDPGPSPPAAREIPDGLGGGLDLGRVHTPNPSHPPLAPAVVAGRDGAVVLVPTAQAAMDHVVAEWQRRHMEGERPRIVALGPEEAEHLNALVGAARLDAGELSADAVEIGGRTFRTGDEVAALRRDDRLGSVRGGTVGLVTAVNAERGRATIQWRDWADTRTVVEADAGATGARRRRPVPLTHGYATTPPYLRAGHDGPVLSLGHVEAVAPRLHPDRIYDVVPPIAVADRTRDARNPVAPLLAELRGRTGTPPAGAPPARDPPSAEEAPARDPPVGPPATALPHAAGRPPTAVPYAAGRPPTAVPHAAGRPLSELVVERDRLAQQLVSAAPPDPGPDRRRVAEERAWRASVPVGLRRPDQAAALAALDRRQDELAVAAWDRAAWLQQNRGPLERWADLETAVAWREAALGRGAELRPTVAVEAALGPRPADRQLAPAWARAAQAVEVHRERFALPDRPLELAEPAAPPPDLARRAGELRVLEASRQLQHGRERDRSLAPSGR